MSCVKGNYTTKFSRFIFMCMNDLQYGFMCTICVQYPKWPEEKNRVPELCSGPLQEQQVLLATSLSIQLHNQFRMRQSRECRGFSANKQPCLSEQSHAVACSAGQRGPDCGADELYLVTSSYFPTWKPLHYPLFSPCTLSVSAKKQKTSAFGFGEFQQFRLKVTAE